MLFGARFLCRYESHESLCQRCCVEYRNLGETLNARKAILPSMLHPATGGKVSSCLYHQEIKIPALNWAGAVRNSQLK